MQAVETRSPAGAANWAEMPAGTAQQQSSLSQGLYLFSLYYILYAATLVDAIAPFSLPLNILFSIANGVFIAMLFILGHDCCHGTLVPGRKWNLWLGRIAFVPAIHSVSLWRETHNKLHHGRTNLKGFDPVWAPMSIAEYRAASPARRWLERAYRSGFGPVIYYLIDIWIPKLVLPFQYPKQWKRHLPDSIFVIAGFAFTLMIVVILGKALSPDRALWLTLTLGWVIPFAVWNYLAAITTYMNHTHPEIAWFADESEWSSHGANVAGTVYVTLPLDILPLYSDVMAHTAHHAKLAAPVYALPDEQVALKARFGADIKEYRFSISGYRRIAKTCKLFDFEKMCWTDFAGVPTSVSIKAP